MKSSSASDKSFITVVKKDIRKDWDQFHDCGKKLICCSTFSKIEKWRGEWLGGAKQGKAGYNS